MTDGDGPARAPLDPAAFLAGVPCCPELRAAIVDGRPSISYRPARRAIYLLDKPPGHGMVLLRYCPFCGDALLPELGGQRDEIAIEAGFEPNAFDPPEGFLERFGTDAWWRERLDRDPAAFLVALPRPGDVLAIGEGRLEVIVLAIHPRHMFEQFLIARTDELGLPEPRLVITSTRAFSQGRWPIVRRDLGAAAALAARVRIVSGNGWPGSRHWVMAQPDGASSGTPEAASPDDALIVDELEDEYSIEVEALLTGTSLEDDEAQPPLA